MIIQSLFLQLENLLDNHSLDYIDIAGGCNLKAADFQTSSIEGLLAQQNYSNTVLMQRIFFLGLSRAI